ncbi:hypothetical protein [Dactylosporangium darangshiense]|uniref:Uncharacterized protein n=1 Tax=Dactylosporangium darangshiense TaxID=579108 RepID=A0ABP8DPE6_9ACTN
MSEKWEYGYVYFVSTQSEEQRNLRIHPDESKRAIEYDLAAVVVDGEKIRSQAIPGKVTLLNELGNDGWQVESGLNLAGHMPNWLREAVRSAVSDADPSGAIEHCMRRRRPVATPAPVTRQQSARANAPDPEPARASIAGPDPKRAGTSITGPDPKRAGAPIAGPDPKRAGAPIAGPDPKRAGTSIAGQTRADASIAASDQTHAPASVANPQPLPISALAKPRRRAPKTAAKGNVRG